MEPATTQAKAKGLTPILDLSQAGAPWVFDAVAMTAPYIRDNRATATGFVKGYIEGAYWGLKNEEEAKKVIAARFKTQDKAVIDSTYDEFKKTMPFDGKPSAEGAKNVIDQLSALGNTVTSRKIEDYIDLSLIADMEKQGFFDQMKKTYGVPAK
jgi:ABC-type nitrate/sulfonate/bicarbonate transport system substrate-binding protein